MTASARGQFAATGKARKPRPQYLMDGSIAVTDERLRAEDDFEPTPSEPTLALVAYEEPWIRRHPLIWEAACGDGRMMRDLASCGLQVVGSDLRDRGCNAEIGDFFSYRAPKAAALITNPPFNRVNWRDGKGAWVEHGLGTLGLSYMALLLPLQWLCVAQLGPLRQKYRPSAVYAINWRIDFSGEGQQPANHCWVVWDRARPMTGSTPLTDMFPADPRQIKLPGVG